MKEFLYVGAGGFIGSALRYGINLLSYRIISVQIIPYGTLIVNCVGCFFIGLIMGLLKKNILLTDNFNLFLITGLLGGLTTFSTFGNESIKLFLLGDSQLFFVNIFFNVFFSLFAVWLGYFIFR